jgi:uncharacterized membrane protein
MMMYGRGFFGRAGHMGAGFLNSGWSWLVIIGIVLLVAALIYFMVSKSKSVPSDYNATEALKMKFVQSEISEKEYRERKDILNGK